jgi:hypothetical protein
MNILNLQKSSLIRIQYKEIIFNFVNASNLYNIMTDIHLSFPKTEILIVLLYKFLLLQGHQILLFQNKRIIKMLSKKMIN